MAIDYDEEKELARYLFEHYQHLMTPFELTVYKAILGRMKAAAYSGPMARMFNEKWGRVGDPEVEGALAVGPEVFRQRVCRRVLAEAGKDVFVNRCSHCRRVLRTPKAQQCFWCGFDWHGGFTGTEPAGI
jgi:hypothetical protein